MPGYPIHKIFSVYIWSSFFADTFILLSSATVDEPEGDLDLLAKSLEAMNAEPDESKEERTGGSGQLGKMIFSCDNGTICAIAYIPQSLKGQVCVLFLPAALHNPCTQPSRAYSQCY